MGREKEVLEEKEGRHREIGNRSHGQRGLLRWSGMDGEKQPDEKHAQVFMDYGWEVAQIGIISAIGKDVGQSGNEVI